MKPFINLLVVSHLLLVSCGVKTNEASTEMWKQEILETEESFALMVKEKGMREAFLHFAADNAVLMRQDSLIHGINGIKDYLDKNVPENNSISLTWQADYVDVAASGDIGYTYGPYTFSYTDSTGATMKSTGVFHTVWKKQADNTWRYVWD